MVAPVRDPEKSIKPGIWLGHVSIPADDLPATYDFYLGLGLRAVVMNEHVGVLELAGGTHVVLAPRRSDGASDMTPSIDLMVDDVDGAHEAWSEHGPSEIVTGSVHRTFTLSDPSGNKVIVHDSHVVGAV